MLEALIGAEDISFGSALNDGPARIPGRGAGCSCSAGRRHLGGAPGRSACSICGRGSSSSWPGRIWPRIRASRRPQARRENWAELRPIIAAWLDRFTSADAALAALSAARIPCARVLWPAEVGRGAAHVGTRRLPVGRPSDARPCARDGLALPRGREAARARRAGAIPARRGHAVRPGRRRWATPDRIEDLARRGAVVGPGLAAGRPTLWPVRSAPSRIGAARRPEPRDPNRTSAPKGGRSMASLTRADARRGQARRRDVRGGGGRHDWPPRRPCSWWCLASVASGVGRDPRDGVGGLLSGRPWLRCIGWYVWAFITYFVGTRSPARPKTRGGHRAAPADHRLLSRSGPDPWSSASFPVFIGLLFVRRHAVDAGGHGRGGPPGPRLRVDGTSGRRLRDRAPSFDLLVLVLLSKLLGVPLDGAP